MKDNIVVGFSNTNPMSGKIIVLELQPRMLLSNQIAIFVKLQYLKNISVYYFNFLHIIRHQSVRLGFIKYAMEFLKIFNITNS